MAESLLQELKSKYLASVKKAFQHIEDNDSHVGKIVCPDQMYPRLRLLRVPRKEEDSIPYSGSLLENVEVTRSSDRYSPTNVQDLFVPDRDGFVPKIAVLVGPPGVGKTVISQKIMLDWASGKLYTDQFNVVFYLSGRAINKIASNVNISDLVAQSSAKLHCPDNLIKSAFNDSSKVLIIIDGFDELRWTLENDYEDYDDPFLKIHKETFLRCLIEKEMLSEASLLITTRSMFLRKLKDFTESSSSVELLGFSERDLETYFHNFFKNEDDVHQAISVLKENEVLLSLCSIPLTCWLVCAILKVGMKNELRSSKCETLTAVYLLYLKSLLTNQGSHQLVLKCLKKLCALANEGILNQKSLFEVDDLERHALTISEVASVFPNNSVFQRDVEASTNFSFIHLSIQEFFAALYYVLGEDAEVKETNEAGGNTYLPKVCKGKSPLYQSEHHPSLNSTVRFLFGLLNDKHLKEFAAALGFSASLRAKSAMEKWLTAEKRSGFCVEAVTCFYEAQDEELRSGAFRDQDLLFQACFYASAMESIPIREMLYCLADRTSFGSICLEDYLMRPRDLELLAPFFHGASKLSFTRCGFADDFTTGEHASFLANPDSKIKELEIHVCVVTPSFYDDLRSLISSSRSLNKLTVSHQILEDSFMKKLCDGLQQPDCTLQELILEDCNLAAPSCEILGAALKANRSLLKLDLTLNKIEDEGMKFLCEALKNPACIMRELWIAFSELTSACCEHLRSSLMTNQNLNTLCMRECNLQDAGVKLLCEALQQPGCTVKELGLYENNLSGAVCEDLRSVLLTNRTLTSLNLTYNDLGDSGVKLLCEGLCDPGCTLQKLVLIHCELTPLSCKDLSSTLLKSRSLNSLDLTWNNLQDSGVTVLCEGLRDPNCILKELRLSGCDMSDLALKEFSTVIVTNRSLINLDLSGNNKYKSSGVETICKALRNPACALQEFRMGYCEMTPTCAEDLLAMIDTNKSLNVLEVSFAYEDEAPPADLDEMCRKFEHPSCTLEKNDTQDGLFIYFKYKKQK